MSAPKETADWFPFNCADGRTLTILQQRFQLEGLGFFTSLMMILTKTPRHHLDLSNEVDRIYMYSKIGCNAEKAESMIATMVQTEKLDKRLWEQRKIIYCGDLIESLSTLYSKRTTKCPTADELFRVGIVHSASESDIPNQSDAESDIPGVSDPHRIGQDRIGQDSTKSAREDIPAEDTFEPPETDPVRDAYRDGIAEHLPAIAWPNTHKQYDALRELSTRTADLAPDSAIPDPCDFARAILRVFEHRKATERDRFWTGASWEPVTILRRFGTLVQDLSDGHSAAAEDSVKLESLRGMYATD